MFFLRKIKFLFQCILSVIYYTDSYCNVCNDYLSDDDSFLCFKCANNIKGYDDCSHVSNGEIKFTCYSATYYSSVVKELIHGLKYKKNFVAGNILGKYMKNLIEDKDIRFDIITYVPMTRKNQKERQFNQSEFLAENIRVNNIKVESLIKKIKNTKDQIGLSKEERWNNLEGCFQFVGRKSSVKDKRVLLIDDVITTGATAFYCACILKDNGAKEVIILTAAKGSL